MGEKIEIYYFSGTGNTKSIVNKVSDNLNNRGYEVAAFPIEKGFHTPKTVIQNYYLHFPPTVKMNIIKYGGSIYAF